MSTAAPAPSAAPAAPAAPAPAKAPSLAEQRLAKEHDVAAKLRAHFPAGVLGERVFANQLWVDVAPEALRGVLRYLRDDASLEFKLLLDVTCADFSKLPQWAKARYGVSYVLHSLKLDSRFRLRCWVPSSGEIPSASEVFGGANWAEREIFDLYGVRFTGHPLLKRILLPDEYVGHPLRKDYPLKGRGERDSFPVLLRSQS